MRLAPVGSPPPDWPADAEFKPALGVWAWHPAHGELRLEIISTLFRNVISDLWAEYRTETAAAEGLQPVITFTDRVEVRVKAINKQFFVPIVKIVGWVERSRIPGWADRPPTVPAPAPMQLLPTSSAPAPVVAPSNKAARLKPPKGAAKPGPDKPGPIDPNLNDDIPWK